MKAIVRRFYQSATWMTWASFGARSVNTFVVLPLVLRLLEPAAAAVWFVLLSFNWFQMIFQMGIAPVAARFVTYARSGARTIPEGARGMSAGSSPNTELLKSVVACGGFLYLFLAVLYFIFVALGAVYLCAPHIAAMTNPADGWTSATIIAICSPLLLYGAHFQNTLIGLDEMAVMRRWEALFNFVSVIASVGVLVLTKSLAPLAAVFALFQTIALFRNRYLAGQSLRALGTALPRPRFDRQVWREMWPCCWRSGVGTAFAQGILQGIPLLLSRQLEATVFASLMATLRIVSQVALFAQAPFYTKIPKLGQLLVQGDHNALRTLAERSILKVMLLFGLSMAGLIALGTPALELVGTHTQFLDRPLFALLALTFLIERYSGMHIQVHMTTNHIPSWWINGLAAASLAIFILLPFPNNPLHTILFGLLASRLLITFPICRYYSLKSFQLPLAFELRSGFPAAIALICLAGFGF